MRDEPASQRQIGHLTTHHEDGAITLLRSPPAQLERQRGLPHARARPKENQLAGREPARQKVVQRGEWRRQGRRGSSLERGGQLGQDVAHVLHLHGAIGRTRVTAGNGPHALVDLAWGERGVARLRKRRSQQRHDGLELDPFVEEVTGEARARLVAVSLTDTTQSISHPEAP